MSGLNPILTCSEIVDLLAEDLDQTLPVSLDLKFRLHLFLCRSCRCFRRTYRKTVGIAHALRAIENRFDPGLLPNELVQRIMQRRKMARMAAPQPLRPDSESAVDL